MIQFLMDTEHLTLFLHRHAPLLQRIAAAPPTSVVISPVSVEETLRGRLAVLARKLQGEAHVQAYERLLTSMSMLCALPLAPFDLPSESLFQSLRGSRIRVGSRDLKIASIGLTHNLTVLTRNIQDFERVPNLRIEDWSK